MYIKKQICPLPFLEPVVFDYSSEEHCAVDSPVMIYTEFKISILLTDDLAAVTGKDVYNTVRGDLIVFRPDEIHFGRFLRAGLHRYLDFFIPERYFERFNEDCSSLMLPLTDKTPDRINLVHPEDKLRADILHVAEKLSAIAELPTGEPACADTLIFAYMIQLLSLCRDAYVEQKKHPLATSTPAVVTKIIGYVNENFTGYISLDNLANAIGSSITYLTRTFRRYTGKTIHGYLTECRLDYAKKLLISGMTVTEACYCSGFGDCSNFIRVFRRFTGMTPNQYKIDGASWTE